MLTDALRPSLSECLVAPRLHRVVVLAAGVVGVEELLEPLEELEVVLELGLHQLVHLNTLDREGQFFLELGICMVYYENLIRLKSFILHDTT